MACKCTIHNANKSEVKDHDPMWCQQYTTTKAIEAPNCLDTSLHYSAGIYTPRTNNVRDLIASGSKIDCFGHRGLTPLMIAVQKGYKKNVRALLEAGANINITNSKGENALFMALHSDIDYKVVEAVLLQAKAEAPTSAALVQKLLAAGCSFPHAVLVRDADVIKHFLILNFDIDSRDYEKRTALHLAALSDQIELVQLLIDHGANVNVYDDATIGPLYFAANRVNPAMIKLLLKHGADPYPIESYMFDRYPLFVPLLPHVSDNIGMVHKCTELLLHSGAFPNNKENTRWIIFAMLDEVSRGTSRCNNVIAHLAMLDMISVAKGDQEKYPDTLLNLKDVFYVNYYEKCREILKITVTGKMSLLDLLADYSEHKMRVLMRGNKTFVSEVEEFCRSKPELQQNYSYYVNTMMKQINKIIRMIELENKAIPIICQISNCGYNELYVFARRVVGYLNERDLEQLCQV